MVCSAQKVKVAVKSAKIGASSHVTNSILKNAAKWLVYASTVTYLLPFNLRLMCVVMSLKVNDASSITIFMTFSPL